QTTLPTLFPIPRTAVRGPFISNLRTNNAPHTLPNPTDRSPWSLHIQPTNQQTLPTLSPFPRTAVRGPFISNLRTNNAPHTLPNPTDRSPWLLHTQPTKQLVFLHKPPYPPPMFLTPFDHLTWAYQLHYHICFRTHLRRNFFADKTTRI